MYHKVDLVTPTKWWVTPDALARQIARLRPCEFVYLDDYDPANRRHVVLTFDDAYENVHRHALPILERERIPFEVFVIGDLIGGWNDFDTAREPRTRFASLEQLQEMAARGARLQWHSRTHANLTSLGDAHLERELDVPAALREKFPQPHFRWLAYPYGSHDARVVDATRRRFDGAVTAVPGPMGDRWRRGRTRVLEDTDLRRQPSLRGDLAGIERALRAVGDAPGGALTELEQMVLALEDRRFFHHPGVDVLSVAREMLRLLTFRKHGGASTIEMQLVRTVTGYRQATVRRKLYEMMLALIVSFRYPKRAILRCYMGCAFFGSGLIGARAAARTMFRKEPDQLAPAEAAFVAAMLARPRPQSGAPAWEANARRRAEYGLRIRAAQPPQVPGSAPAPAAAAPGELRVVGDQVIGPDGNAFASARRRGFVAWGSTSLGDWLAHHPSAPGLAPSAGRVLRAAALNEGRFEAVNSYDDAFLSFGLFQWSAGVGALAGELAGLLDLIRRTDERAFDACFGCFGLGVTLEPAEPGRPRAGFLTLAGAPLRDAGDKEQLRGVQWVHRFWRAGHDEIVRRCQAELAASRIRLLSDHLVRGRPLSDYLTSEHGMALLLDQHVNRPAQVAATLERALARLPGATASLDPSRWSDAHEHELIACYVLERNDSNMSAPQERAARILECVRRGELSGRRGSLAP